MRIVRTLTAACVVALLLPGCPAKDEGDTKSKEGKGEEKKKEKKEKDPGEPTLKVAEGDPPVDGPVPPETSMVLFSIEGAMYPLACFDKDSGSLKGGADCLGLVATGAEVRLSSVDGEYNKVAGDKIEPQCLAGSGKKVAIGVQGITEGAQFVFGTFPRSTMKLVTFVGDETLDPSETRLDDDEKEKLVAAIGGSASVDTIEAHQKAEIDLDGDDKKEKVYSVYIPNPKVSEQYNWSGIFVAQGGDLGSLVLLEKTKSMRDVFEVRGTVDLDGDNKKELWMRMVFEEGAGDRIVKLDGKNVDAVSGWSCGAAR